MVLIDVIYVLKFVPKQVTVQMDTVKLLRENFALLRANSALLRTSYAMLTLNVALLKFMDCVLDLQIRIYLYTHLVNSYYEHQQTREN